MLEAHVLAIVLIGVSCFIIGSIPIKFARWTRQPFTLSLLLCCGGGVLLATSIVHMLSEVRHQLTNYAELIFCAGFLFLYACDEFLHLCVQDVHSASEHHSEKSASLSRRASSSSEDLHVPPISHQHRTSYGTIDKLPKRARFYSLSQSFQPTISHEFKPRPPSSLSGHTETTHQHHCCRSHDRERSFQKLLDKSEAGGYRGENAAAKSSSDSSEWSDHVVDECHTEVQQPCPKQSSSSISGLLAALLIHSLLEGCSIGVQNDSTEVLLILGAVASHKLVLAFCLGMEMAAAGYDGFKFISAITAFSVGCPIGIAVGATLNASADVFFVEAPLQAVAAGSLLYVAVFEVLPREKFKWQHRSENRFATFFQMLSVLIGFGFISLLSVLLQGVHNH